MKKHIVKVSREGMSACPSCKQHITLDAATFEANDCPFCGANLSETLRQGKQGSGLGEIMRSSRSGIVAVMLGASLTVACGTENNEPAADMSDNNATPDMMTSAEEMGVDMQVAPNNEFVGDYGIAPNINHSPNTGSADMGSDQGE